MILTARPLAPLCIAAGLLAWRLHAAHSAVAEAAHENDRLVAELRASLVELSASRARLVTVADLERRRIERDLHDGAQQRLIALQIKLALLREQIAPQAPESARALAQLEREVEAAAEDVRSLAHGIHPQLLSARGLGDALRAVARTASLPTTVHDAGVGRYDATVESAVYFACLEALQNAAKHARGATRITIALEDTAELRFSVRDDGAGFRTAAAPAHDGAGLANLHDRLAAVGGELEVVSAPGEGTCVRGVVPLPEIAPATASSTSMTSSFRAG